MLPEIAHQESVIYVTYMEITCITNLSYNIPDETRSKESGFFYFDIERRVTQGLNIAIVDIMTRLKYVSYIKHVMDLEPMRCDNLPNSQIP